MVSHIVTLLYLAQLSQGASTNTTNTDRCPLLDETSRSVWSILGSCAVTLLICVWHTLHLSVFRKYTRWRAAWVKVGCILGSFFAPEVVVAVASEECWVAYKNVLKFREKGYNWSMTHSFFAGMNGFVYRDGNKKNDEDDEDELDTIDSLKFLEHCEKNVIANPLVKVKHIRDKSKSDWLGKAILAIQLTWFVLQVVVRGSRGLAITLVELDTVCMAVLSLLVIFLWWHKPLRPECPHVFYASRNVGHVESEPDIKVTSDLSPALAEDKRKKALSNAWKPEPLFPDRLTSWFTCARKSSDEAAKLSNVNPFSKFDKLVLRSENENSAFAMVSLCVTWVILGALHLIAWDFEFPTIAEKILWRVASLVLATGIPFFFLSTIFITFLVFVVSLIVPTRGVDRMTHRMLGVALPAIMLVAVISGVISRAILVGLMLASLRALPCSAHQSVSWTVYIPHL